MDGPSVLIVGGYGAFGARAATRLARFGDCDLVLGGRNIEHAAAAARALSASSIAQSVRSITATRIDAGTAMADDIRALRCSVVLNASGPFQNTPPQLAQACIEAGCHYVDLADDRAFVTGISDLDADAKASGVLVVAGASTVPAISAAVIDALRPRFGTLRKVIYGISPGNSFDPGLATVQSILSYVGKPFEMRSCGGACTVYGWQGLRRQPFGSLGARWLGDCDIPDLALFPERFPEIETLRFGAGVEVGMFHLGLWGVSWLVRGGLVRKPAALAGSLLALKRRLSLLGSDAGGMVMEFAGTDIDGAPRKMIWTMVARSGHGPMIPPTPAVIVVRKLLDGRLTTRGAQACLDLVTLAEIEGELGDLDVEFKLA